MTRVTQSARGFDALRRRLADLPLTAQAAAAAVLHQMASETAEAIRADLPDGADIAVRVEDDPRGSAVAVVGADARAFEYGSLAKPPRPVLRPLGLAAGARAPGLLAAALRKRFDGGRP